MNCLEHCLSQWLDLRTYRIWYDSDHVVIIEPEIDLHDKGYLPLDVFGEAHFVSSFGLDRYFSGVLRKYFNEIVK